MMNSGGIGVPLGFPLGPTSVIQVTNLSSAVTSEQMRTLFGFLGDIEELRLYPPDNAPLAFSSKVCYIKFREASSVGVAQHLTNTVFIDRALIVVPCAEVMQPTRTVVMCKTTFDHRENTALGKRPCLISFGS
ncbi:PREDICTED: splicing regulatory glutamine/lysine-rich protein 1 isoform X3 [Ficedula albicollis]|uniref:RRM domain-containing protein n=4 Tax=Telluraves TaxID=3073808 RepID=A0A8C8BDV4_9STRI|nr:PREDICTED: splicing regulatory glutamine/lysine-rich protein 1 isoform X3 [Ficedula albicollis]